MLKPAFSGAVPPAPKVAAAIYSTPDYTAWREIIIRRAGGRCQAPGCDRADARMYADHIHELRDGGSPYDPRNGQCLCASHHATKTNLMRSKRQSTR